MEVFGDCLVSDNYPLTHVMEFQIYMNLLYCSSPNGVHVTYFVHGPYSLHLTTSTCRQLTPFHGCFRIEVELLPIQKFMSPYYIRRFDIRS